MGSALPERLLIQLSLHYQPPQGKIVFPRFACANFTKDVYVNLLKQILVRHTGGFDEPFNARAVTKYLKRCKNAVGI